jgi:hypothetical protein
MPTDSKVYRFANRWYPIATQTAADIALNDTTKIRLISAQTTYLASDAASQ